MADTVLVTGITGYIGSHVAAKLVGAGYDVRGTVRALGKGRRVLKAMSEHGVDSSRIDLVQANLASDEGWKAAVEGCRFVQHIASPFPSDPPRDREALVPEARAGAMRVIEHGLAAGAERVVMTSSLVSMMGQPGRGERMVVTEDDWSDPDWKPLTAYPVSKTRAERAAWDYVVGHGMKERLVTVCPGLVVGPDPFNNGGASLDLIRGLMEGDFPATPRIAYPLIDIRDCAAIHVAAMTAPEAGGRRLMAAGETLWMSQIADVLRESYPGAKLPKRELPNVLVRLLGLFDDRIKSIVPDLGTFHEADSAYVTNITQVKPRQVRGSVVEAGAEYA